MACINQEFQIVFDNYKKTVRKPPLKVVSAKNAHTLYYKF